MPAKLIDGKSIAQALNEKTAAKTALLKKNKITPKLAVILVGEDKPSQTYVKNKSKAAKIAGINFELIELPGNISKTEIIEKIFALQSDPGLSGLIVQLPLPEPLYTDDVLNAIDPQVDVDCLTNANLGRLVMKTNYMVPPTPGAVMSVLRHIGIKDELAGKNVAIIGAGALVGKPLAIMMMNERASVTTVNSATKDIKKKCLNADIIVTGVGKKDILRGDMVKKGAIVIDTGVCFVDGKMYGDVNVEEVIKKASYVTPTPGGIGPITVARLLWNTVICANKKIEHESNE
ncbi:MAG: bifunctional 5,10-methylenetetrahydrofolate dehydrogenase/5,10-methenyltetrahydrofolate cyclohydrolase [Patescibacteria group bacterium]